MDSAAASAPGAMYTRLAVAPPLPISLATERTKPSSARWAMAWRLLSATSGGVASTSTRPDDSMRRITGWKNE